MSGICPSSLWLREVRGVEVSIALHLSAGFLQSHRFNQGHAIAFPTQEHPLKLKPVSLRAALPLVDKDAVVADAPDDEKLRKNTEDLVARIAEIQRLFYADGRFALLVVLQGRVEWGKAGRLRKVFSGGNRQGVRGPSSRVRS